MQCYIFALHPHQNKKKLTHCNTLLHMTFNPFVLVLVEPIVLICWNYSCSLWVPIHIICIILFMSTLPFKSPLHLPTIVLFTITNTRLICGGVWKCMRFEKEKVWLSGIESMSVWELFPFLYVCEQQSNRDASFFSLCYFYLLYCTCFKIAPHSQREIINTI